MNGVTKMFSKKSTLLRGKTPPFEAECAVGRIYITSGYPSAGKIIRPMDISNHSINLFENRLQNLTLLFGTESNRKYLFDNFFRIRHLINIDPVGCFQPVPQFVTVIF